MNGTIRKVEGAFHSFVNLTLLDFFSIQTLHSKFLFQLFFHFIKYIRFLKHEYLEGWLCLRFDKMIDHVDFEICQYSFNFGIRIFLIGHNLIIYIIINPNLFASANPTDDLFSLKKRSAVLALLPSPLLNHFRKSSDLRLTSCCGSHCFIIFPAKSRLNRTQNMIRRWYNH
jgi:hypothetical protein